MEAEFNRTKIEEAQEKQAQEITRETDDTYYSETRAAILYMRKLIRADFDRSDITDGTKLEIITHARRLGHPVLANQMQADL